MISDRMLRLSVQAVGIGGLSVITLLGMMNAGATRIHTWPWVFYTHLALLVPPLLVAIRLIRYPGIRIPGGIPLTVLAAVIGISVAAARHSAFSFEVALLLWSGLCLTAWISVAVAEQTQQGEEARRRLVKVARITMLIASIPLVTAVVWAMAELWEPLRLINGLGAKIMRAVNYRNPHPFGHWNYTAGYALLNLPWLAILSWKERGRWRTCFASLLILGLLVLLWTYSRGAILGLAAMSVAAIGGFVAQRRIQKHYAVGLLVTGALFAIGLLTLNARIRDVLFHPTARLHPSEGDVQRIGMLQAGWRLVQRQPWIGSGPGMTPFLYPEVRADVLGGVETSYQLHNGYLQFWFDHGLAGLLAAAWLAGFALRGGGRALKGKAEVTTELRPFIVASLYSVFGYAVMAATDYQLNVPWIIGALSLHLGVLLSATATLEGMTHPSFRGRAIGFSVLGGILITIGLLSSEWRARHSFWEAWWRTPEKDYVAIARHLQDAAGAEPHNPFYRTSLGLELASIASKTPDPQLAAQTSRGACIELKRSLALDQAQEPAYAALGWLTIGDEPKRAESYFSSALRLLPDRNTLHFGLALARLTGGDKPGGVHALALECLADPAFLASPMWVQVELKTLRPMVNADLVSSYQRAIDDQRTPDWRRPDLQYAQAWTKWWNDGTLPTTAELNAADPMARAFFRCIEEERRGQNPTQLSHAPIPVQALYAAMHNPQRAAVELRKKLPQIREDEVRATLRRIAVYPDKLEDLIRSPPIPEETIFTQPIYRLHFNIMFRNLDGPGYADLAPRPTYAFYALYLAEILPPKGLVPGPVFRSLE